MRDAHRREGENVAMYCEGLIQDCCREVAHLSGDAAEVGTYRGDSAWVICHALPDCTVHLFDTLAGMPDECQPIDTCRPGDFRNTSEVVIRNKLNGCRYELHVGIFPQTAVDILLRFVHVDCDIYFSTRAAMDWAWRNLVPGGLILCDDYKASSCAGAKLAIDEFLAATPEAGKRFWHRLAVISKEA